jgi:ATP phosphoribosyltransferase regulatory subunit
MIEYLESLLIGGGKNLDLQTFKLMDQLTGRMMGFRADMTPQVARIDAHHLKRQVPTRLCYLGTVLHTRPNSFAGSRSPYQVGAELYGYKGIDSDKEVLALMLATLRTLNINDYHVDVGHLGVYQGLVAQANLTPEQDIQLSAAMKRKASSEIKDLLNNWQIATPVKNMLCELVHLSGDYQVLQEARQLFTSATEKVQHALDDLTELHHSIVEPLYFDLAESRGYSYHNGVVFAAYVAKHGEAIAKGGRYDNLGQYFDNPRPATGFSTNLRTIVSLLPDQKVDTPTKIFAPADNDPALNQKINALRQEGYIVIRALSGQQGDAQAMDCEKSLCLQDGEWVVK